MQTKPRDWWIGTEGNHHPYIVHTPFIKFDSKYIHWIPVQSTIRPCAYADVPVFSLSLTIKRLLCICTCAFLPSRRWWLCVVIFIVESRHIISSQVFNPIPCGYFNQMQFCVHCDAKEYIYLPCFCFTLSHIALLCFVLMRQLFFSSYVNPVNFNGTIVLIFHADFFLSHKITVSFLLKTFYINQFSLSFGCVCVWFFFGLFLVEIFSRSLAIFQMSQKEEKINTQIKRKIFAIPSSFFSVSFAIFKTTTTITTYEATARKREIREILAQISSIDLPHHEIFCWLLDLFCPEWISILFIFWLI